MKYPLDTPVIIQQGHGIILDYDIRYEEYTVKLDDRTRIYGIKEEQIKLPE